MKFQCYTLGCKVNQYETQAMEQQLLALGHVSGTDADDCDAYLINTCTVTAVADRKNRTLIRRLRREHPQAVIGVCGCYAQVSAGEVEALGVDVVSGSGGREAFVQLVLDAVRQKKAGQDAGQQVLLDDAMRRRAFESLPAGSLGTRTRAMLKVQDGCCNFCTYCIIPYARGPVRSLPLAQAVEQARALEGYREIVLTGIAITTLTDECVLGITSRASRSHRGAAISKTAARLPIWSNPSAGPYRSSACASARLSRAWWTRTSAAALPRARISARSST